MRIVPLPHKPLNLSVHLNSGDLKFDINFGTKTPAEHLAESIPALRLLFAGDAVVDFVSSARTDGSPT